MQQSVIGVFDNPHDVQTVVDDLVSQGFSRSDIDVIDQQKSLGMSSGQHASSGGMFPSFRRWLDGYGMNEEDRGYVAESVRRGGTLVAIHSEDASKAELAARILSEHGAVDIDRRAEYYRSSGYTSFNENSQPYTKEEMIAERERFEAGGRFTIPVVEEELNIGKREVERGRVRIVSRIVEEPVEKTIQLRDETIEVDRKVVDRPLNTGDLDSFKEGVYEMVETDEIAVVQKEARVKEEILVKKTAEEKTEQIRDSVRKTEVNVERVDTENFDRR